MISLKEILTNSFNTVLEESIEKLNRKRRISVGDLRNQYEKGSKRVKIEPDLDDSGKAVNWDTKAPKSSKKAQTFKGTTRDEKARDVDHVGAHSKSNSSTHTQSASPHTSAAATPSRQISPLPVEKPRKGRRSTKSSEQEPVLPEHRFTKWLYPPQIKELNDKWVKIKQGTFDEEERRIVYDWVNNYKERNNWDNEQLRARIFAPKNEKNRDSFWNDLTEHVPHRVLASVYTHVRSRWHPYANKGIWTKDEEDRLEGAHVQLGNSWSKIADIVERPANECSDHYRRIFDCPNRRKGAWSEEEVREYLSIVEPMLKERNYVTRDGHDPFWVTVQERMGKKRSAHQCRIKWEDELRGRDSPNRRPKADFRRSDCGILIKHILDLRIKDRGVINFKSLSTDTYQGEWPVKMLRDKWRFITYRSCGMDKQMARSLPFEKLMERVKSTYRHEIDGISASDDEDVGDVDFTDEDGSDAE